MTQLECRNAETKYLALKLKIRRLVIGSPEYNEILAEIKELDRIIKLYDASIPTTSASNKFSK